MNFCTKCGSYYEKPGTCNCYAEKEKPAPAAPLQNPPGDNTTLPLYPTTSGGTSSTPLPVWVYGTALPPYLLRGAPQQ